MITEKIMSIAMHVAPMCAELSEANSVSIRLTSETVVPIWDWVI